MSSLNADGQAVQLSPEEEQAEQLAVVGRKRFTSRNDVELEALSRRGKAIWSKRQTIDIEGEWKQRFPERAKDIVQQSENQLIVPMWSWGLSLELAEPIAQLIANTFPEGVFFLWNITVENVSAFKDQILDTIQEKVGEPIEQIVCRTLEIAPEEELEFLYALSPNDLLTVFAHIVEFNINNDNQKALQKKVQAVLAARFGLENVSLPYAAGSGGHRITA